MKTTPFLSLNTINTITDASSTNMYFFYDQISGSNVAQNCGILDASASTVAGSIIRITGSLISLSASAVNTSSSLTGLSASVILLSAERGGWIAVSDVWIYASASVVTVPVSASSTYSVGDKVKFIQPPTQKYYCISASGTNYLELQGGTDYIVSASAIVSIYYSKQTTPLDFPPYFNWSGSGGFNPTSCSATNFYDTTVFQMQGRCVELMINTGGCSLATNYSGTLPVKPAFGTIFPLYTSTCTVRTMGTAIISASTLSIIFTSSASGAQFNVSGSKSAIGNVRYFI
jgi:hypothetical protein